MTKEHHQIYQNLDASAREVFFEGESGTDETLQAINENDKWRCSCGEGPFPDKDAALEHKDSSSED